MRFAFCLFFGAWFLVLPPITSADYTSKLEQQINLVDQEYTTTNSSSSPTNNSLGLIKWQPNQYTGGTVYFEAVIRCDACSGGNNQTTASLYSSGGSLVGDSAVSTGSATYARVRSPAITSNLSNNTLYTARVARDATNGTAYLLAARLIVVQSAENLTGTQTQIEIGDAGSFTNTSYDLMPGGVKIYRFESASFNPLSAVYFEASLQGTDSAGTAYAALSGESDCDPLVTNSEVSITGSTWNLTRSGDIQANLANNTNYWVCVKASPTSGAIANAKIIIDQSDASGLMKVQTFHLYNNKVKYDSDSTYTKLDYANQFNPGNFVADNVTYFLESSLSTTNGTGYLRLFNLTDNSALSSTEIGLDTFGLVRVRSANPINAYLPTSAKNLDVEIKNSASYTTGSNVSWLIINLQRYPDPASSFSVAAVNSGETHNGITTSAASQVTSLPFNTLIPGTPKFLAHLLTASTNSNSGYTVTTKLVNYLQGNDSANNIDAFPGGWGSPISWSSPNSTTPNNNTGWLGANTTDTRVPGWNGASGKFGGLAHNNDYVVMFSSGTDSGTTAYVTYALEVNIFQPADGYSGTIRYNFLPTY